MIFFLFPVSVTTTQFLPFPIIFPQNKVMIFFAISFSFVELAILDIQLHLGGGGLYILFATMWPPLQISSESCAARVHGPPGSLYKSRPTSWSVY